MHKTYTSTVQVQALILPLKKFGQNFLFRTWTIVYGGQKIKSAQKIYASRGNLKCMQTNFGGHGFFSSGDIATFCNTQIHIHVHIHVHVYVHIHVQGWSMLGNIELQYIEPTTLQYD